MQLPNCLQAYIPSEKLSAYLLSETHTVGKAKATFFRALGFNETTMSLLEQGLLILAHNIPVQDVVHCYKDGVTFEVEFMAGEGATIAVLTLSQHDIRPMHAREILHVRALAETDNADCVQLRRRTGGERSQ